MNHKEKIKVLIIFLVIFLVNTMSFTYCQTTGDNAAAITKTSDTTYLINKRVLLNTRSRSISFPVTFNKSNSRNGIIELVLCTQFGKAYESLFTTEVTPIELQTALLLLGYKSLENKLTYKSTSSPNDDMNIKKADSLYLVVQWKDSNKTISKRVENFMWDKQKNSCLPSASWFFNGLLTNYDGKIICRETTSMIVNFYDIYAILSLNNEARFTNGVYYIKADENLLGREVTFIIKPAGSKKKFFKKRLNTGSKN